MLEEPSLRPESLLLSFLGDHVLDRGIYVFSGSIIDALSRAGVSEEATRSTLSRMAQRGLLQRRRGGRRIYFGLTPRTIAILRDGQRRIWELGPVNREANGKWTLLAFSLPEAWQRQRHDLRSRLVWEGFGPLQSGLWMAPSEVDVESIARELGLEARVKVFVANPRPPTDIAQLARDAYDLEDLAKQYEGFVARWASGKPMRQAPDALVRKLLLTTEWLQIIRRDPRLPLKFLPRRWPAVKADRLFKKLDASCEAPARRIAQATLDVIRVGPVRNRASNAG
jgi:phenylacetic acid degradation operon negative regulatory protein